MFVGVGRYAGTIFTAQTLHVLHEHCPHCTHCIHSDMSTSKRSDCFTCSLLPALESSRRWSKCFGHCQSHGRYGWSSWLLATLVPALAIAVWWFTKDKRSSVRSVSFCPSLPFSVTVFQINEWIFQKVFKSACLVLNWQKHSLAPVVSKYTHIVEWSNWITYRCIAYLFLVRCD